jgi:putative pyruvate formate lyase activating enzyme
VHPAYAALSEAEWQERIEAAWELLRNPCPSGQPVRQAGRQGCRVCPRYCKVDRTDRDSPKVGFCRVKDRAVVFSFHTHHGEENPLRGWRGSGTIFFSSCNLSCLFCQNWEISQARHGRAVSEEELAVMMLALQGQGCHNINLVSPSIYVPQIIKAAHIACQHGLRLPFVYNTSAYDSPESLRLLDGIVDIYMPDAKYSDDRVAGKLSLVRDYWQVARAAIKEMHRQVGDLVISAEGLAARGVLVRHLVLPEGLAGTREVARFLAREVSPNTYINVMGQYRPDNRAWRHPQLSRPITHGELVEAVRIAREEGLSRFDERWMGLA